MTDWHQAGRQGRGHTYRPGFTKLPANLPISQRQIAAGVRKLAKPEGVCLDCPKPVVRKSAMGPAPQRCKACTIARKALRDRLRKRGKLPGSKPRRKPVLPRDERPLCCRESGKLTCDQHKQQRQADYDHAREASRMVDRLFSVLGDGFTIQ
jgi:hypothetical protein